MTRRRVTSPSVAIMSRVRDVLVCTHSASECTFIPMPEMPVSSSTRPYQACARGDKRQKWATEDSEPVRDSGSRVPRRAEARARDDRRAPSRAGPSQPLNACSSTPISSLDPEDKASAITALYAFTLDEHSPATTARVKRILAVMTGGRRRSGGEGAR